MFLADDDDDGFRNNAGENARNAAIASAASNSAFEETATTPRMGVSVVLTFDLYITSHTCFTFQ